MDTIAIYLEGVLFISVSCCSWQAQVTSLFNYWIAEYLCERWNAIQLEDLSLLTTSEN